MAQTNIDHGIDLIDMSESDGDTLYRLPTPLNHFEEEDESSNASDVISSSEDMPTRKRNVKCSTRVQQVNSAITVGPNSLHTNEGARENISDRSLRNGRLSRTPRSERPGELEVVAEVHNQMTSKLPPFDSRSGGRQHSYLVKLGLYNFEIFCCLGYMTRSVIMKP